METTPYPKPLSLRKIVLLSSGQDVWRCRNCACCEIPPEIDLDISLESLIQMVCYNDAEVLTSRTLWNDQVLVYAKNACSYELNLSKVIQALRAEALRRGIDPIRLNPSEASE